MKSSRSVIILLIVAFLAGCGGDDADYKSGMYWLTEKDNWQSAAQAFDRALAKKPDSWKINLALVEALSRGDDNARLERHVADVFRRFPDSTRSSAVISAAGNLLGESRIDYLSGVIDLQNTEKVLTSKGDKPELLSRAIIAACRCKDQGAASAYLGRLLEVNKGNIPDSVRIELSYFIGSAQLERIELSAKLDANPNDSQALLALARASILSWDIPATQKALSKLAVSNPELIESGRNASMFAALWDIDPFKSNVVTIGWDGSRSSNGNQLLFLRDLGTPSEPDKYIFRNAGGSDQHTMKAAQQGLREIALPRFSVDGSWIYFYSSADKNWKPGGVGRFNLYRIKPSYGASPEKLTDEDLIYCEPYLEATGSVLLVRKDVGSVRQSAEVFRIKPGSSSTESVVRIAEPVQWATFTKNADSLLFITPRGIYKRALSGGATVLEMTGQGYSYPLVSPDGKWLLLQGNTGLQLLFDRTTGQFAGLGYAHSGMGWFSKSGELLVTRFKSGKPVIVEYNLNSPVNVSRELIAKVSSQEG